MADKSKDDGHGGGGHGHLDPAHLIGHVKDSEYFEVPSMIVPGGKVKLDALQLNKSKDAVFTPKIGVPQVDELLSPVTFRFTKYMALDLVAAVLLVACFVRLAGRVRTGDRPVGRWWNMLEAILLFLRDEVARPSIGQKDGDKYLPFIWTMFFFILTCNLLGMVPWAGSPTAAFAVTGSLAFIVFCVVVGSGMKRLGAVGFWKAQVPHMEVPLVIGIGLIPMIFVIEVMGMFIKHFVLAVRLLANILAGHLVLTVLVTFILVAKEQGALVYAVAPASIFGAVALSMLEVFVAFLQAYIFCFLTSLFIGMALHPH